MATVTGVVLQGLEPGVLLLLYGGIANVLLSLSSGPLFTVSFETKVYTGGTRTRPYPNPRDRSGQRRKYRTRETDRFAVERGGGGDGDDGFFPINSFVIRVLNGRANAAVMFRFVSIRSIRQERGKK